MVAAATLSVLEGSEALGAGRRIAVQRVIPHPQYDSGKMRNDIALLQLAQPSTRPRQLLASAAVAPALVAPGINATVVGWGEMNARATSSTLLQASLPVVALERCREVYRDPYEILDSNICAGGEAKGSDSCQGDSGGPLFATLPVSGPVQVGIVSWGIGCRREGKYGVYTAVAAFEAFIRQYVSDASFATDATPSQPGPLTSVAAAQPAALPSPGLVRQVSVDVTPTGPVKLGTSVTLSVRSTDAGTLLLYSKDADGKMVQLFPNKFVADNPSAFTAGRSIKADVTAVIPGPADRFTITAAPPPGRSPSSPSWRRRKPT
ncbi:trypsin-like serine protease [Dankookia sp. P2]|uniref:trypsin-like serine protease n=1 Tax=Dankookia sp. P2 TaxID=3423955 RepID=UPI003D67C48B